MALDYRFDNRSLSSYRYLSSRPTLIRGYFCLHSNSRETLKLRLSADITFTTVFTLPYLSANLYKMHFKQIWLLILFEVTHLHTFFLFLKCCFGYIAFHYWKHRNTIPPTFVCNVFIFVNESHVMSGPFTKAKQFLLCVNQTYLFELLLWKLIFFLGKTTTSQKEIQILFPLSHHKCI